MNFELTQQQAAIQENSKKIYTNRITRRVLERDANSEFLKNSFTRWENLD